jgi:hypothetical protein
LGGTDDDAAIGIYPCGFEVVKYLPVEVREGYRDVFAFPDLIPAIVDIIDQYRLLGIPTGLCSKHADAD